MVASQNLLIALCLSYQLHASLAFKNSIEEPVTEAFEYMQKPVLKQPRNGRDLEVLLEGVENIGLIDADETVGFLSVYGSKAFPVVAGKLKSTTNVHPVVAAGTLGSGKMVGFAHENLVEAEDDDHGNISGRKKLILNSLVWASYSSESTLESLHVGFYGHGPWLHHLFGLMEFYNITSTRINPDDVDHYSKLAEYDVIVSKHYPNEEQVLILKEYVEHGGGLLLGYTGWSTNARGYFNHVNKIASHAGFVWGDCYVFVEPESDAGISAAQDKLKNKHVQDAWRLIKRSWNPPEALWDIVANGLQFIPPKDKFWQETNFYAEAMSILLRKSLFGK